MTHVLLNNVDHHDLRVLPLGEESCVNQVMVFPNEFEALQRDYPIVFRKDAEGALRPIALFGLASGENLFLGNGGEWTARHVPALIERGPFTIAAPDSAEGEPMIRIDLDHPRVSRTEGEPLFLPHGGNSPFLLRMTDVLRAIYLGHHLLDPLVAALDAARLLRPVNLEIRIDDGEAYGISDVLVIDRERLCALSADELATLHEGGFLQSAFLAAASLGNVQRLADLKRARRDG